MLLAVDTSTPNMGLALVNDGRVVAEFTWAGKAMHTVELAPTVNELFHKTGIGPKDLDGIGVAIGPGSFTSLRVGLSFVKGLAFARGIPVAAINSLQVLAAGVMVAKETPMLCTLPAGRGRHACGTFQYTPRKKWHLVDEPVIRTAKEIAETETEPILFCGDMSAEERAELKANTAITLMDPIFCVRRPAVLGTLAEKKISKGLADELFSLAPAYLHIANPIPASQ